MEEYLLEQLRPHQKILYLWQSDQAVVLGKNQNPWNECSVSLIKKNRIKLARRLSGGGTVYHDYGNLNYAFFGYEDSYNFSDQMQIIISALHKKGIPVTLDKNHTLTINGLKCSGNAFCFRKKKAFHHGTLLVNANLDKLERYLSPPMYQIETKAIESKRARVINLCDIIQGISCKEVADAITESYANFHRVNPPIYDSDRHLDKYRLGSLYQQYKSWAWIYGNTPKFQIRWQKEFPWGKCRLCLHVEKARVLAADMTGENINTGYKRRIKRAITGSKFDSNYMVKRIRENLQDCDQSSSVVDVVNWIEEVNV